MSVKTELFTGLRPTGDLTLGNYLGAVKPIIDLQESSSDILIFIADLHALTDQEPEVVSANTMPLIADLMAGGLDMSKANIFLQSAIREQVLYLAMLLSRHISVAELMRVPALKDKLKDEDHPERAKVMLANYPIMMAADILLQGAVNVPVGEDQISHIEVTRLLARRFNTAYGEVFGEPQPQEVKPLRIMSLTGDGKMSKSSPSGAILMSEPVEEAAKKIKRAETAVEGEMTPVLQSHFEIAYSFATNEESARLDEIKKKHMNGEKVMGDFKTLLAEIVSRFLADFQQKRQQILSDQEQINRTLGVGNDIAKNNANAVISAAMDAAKLS